VRAGILRRLTKLEPPQRSLDKEIRSLSDEELRARLFGLSQRTLADLAATAMEREAAATTLEALRLRDAGEGRQALEMLDRAVTLQERLLHESQP